MKAYGLSILSVVQTTRELGVDVEPLFEGLSFTEVDLLGGLPWVPWNDVAVWFNRLEPKLDLEAFVELARRHMGAHPTGRVLAQLVTSSGAWLELYWRMTEQMNPMLDITYEQSAEEHRCEVHLREGLAPCPLWFLLSHHATRFSMLPIGGAPLEVISFDYDGTSFHARYRPPQELAPGAERTRAASEIPLATVFASLDYFGAQLGPAIRDGHLTFDESVRCQIDEVATLAEAWSVTPTEARVALSLTEGKTPTEVAAALGMAPATVRVHLKHLYAKTETVGQRELVTRMKTWRLR